MKESIINKIVPQKVVLIVTGCFDKGKTTSVKNIYNYFRNLPGCSVVEPFTKDNGYKPTEIKAILKVNGVIIGFESEGDPGSRLTQELLCHFFPSGCDLIVCAARNGLTKPECRPLISILDELKNNHPDYRVICTSNYEDQHVVSNDANDLVYCSALNQAFADAMVDLIKKIYPVLS